MCRLNFESRVLQRKVNVRKILCLEQDSKWQIKSNLIKINFLVKWI